MQKKAPRPPVSYRYKTQTTLFGETKSATQDSLASVGTSQFVYFNLIGQNSCGQEELSDKEKSLRSSIPNMFSNL